MKRICLIFMIGCGVEAETRYEYQPPTLGKCRDIAIGFWGQWEAVCHDPRQRLEEVGDHLVCRCKDDKDK